MSAVKSFRIHPEHGVPDKDIRMWLNQCEKEMGVVSVNTTLIPAIGRSDPRLTVIVTRLDEEPVDYRHDPPFSDQPGIRG